MPACNITRAIIPYLPRFEKSESCFMQSLLDPWRDNCYKNCMLNHNIVSMLAGLSVLVAPSVVADECLNLAVGQSKTLTLPGNPTTGFMWSVAEAPDAVQVKVELAADAAPRGMVGTPRATVVTITAVKSGQGAVKLVYARPWEKDKAPAETRIVNVTVQ